MTRKSTRQSPLADKVRRIEDESGGETVTDARKPASRRRPWDGAHNHESVTYRRIPRELQATIKTIADEQHVAVGEVARFFLEYALAAYEAGELKLSAGPGGGKLTLYGHGRAGSNGSK